MGGSASCFVGGVRGGKSLLAFRCTPAMAGRSAFQSFRTAPKAHQI
jgi:hypothetical protein